jgi:serine/threonine protein kinase
VIGAYEVVGELGSGAMATVHLARQSGLDRAVALKELNQIGLGDSRVAASRFLREARLAGSLSHPNIVTVFEYFEFEARPYIAMEYISGGSLRERGEDLSLCQILGVLDGVLAALTHAEAHGIVHRDIKPENILVTADGRVKIADFGIAKARTLTSNELLTVTSATIGTPMYMAPEQVTGEPVSVATDLYALGVVAWEMLLGHVPFGSSDSPISVLWQHVNEPVPDARALRPDLHPGLLRCVERLLAKDPAERPASAAEVLEAIEEIALEHLGSRWRRDAALPPRGARVADHPAADAPSPPTPPPPLPEDRNNPGATKDAGSTIDTPAAPEQTEQYGGNRHDVPAPVTPAPASVRWTLKGALVMLVAALIAAGVGYLAFESPPDDGPTVEETRFASGVERMLDAWNTTRVRERQLLKEAASAGAQADRAEAIAEGYRAAIEALRQLEPSAGQRAAAQRLSAQLVLGGNAYDALARAASGHRRAEYDEQSEAVEERDAAVLQAASVILNAHDS